MGSLVLKHGRHLAAFASMDALGRPFGFPVFKVGVLLLNRLEAPTFEGRALGVANGMFHRAFAVGVPHACRVAHDAVVLQGGGIDRVEFGFV